jgi:hypothetical protein
MPTPDITLSTSGTQLSFLLNFEPSNVLALYDCPIVFIAVVSSAKYTQTHNEEGYRISLDKDFPELRGYQESRCFYTI